MCSGVQSSHRPMLMISAPKAICAGQMPVGSTRPHERLDLSYSDYIANVLAAAHGYPAVAVPPPSEAQLELTG